MEDKYLFCSQRLGFRNWKEEDLHAFAKINADTDVMEHFPKPLSLAESKAFLLRLQEHFDQYGYTYFATEILETGELIGFIGLAYQDFSASFTPATDIGWRLAKDYWGRGYATEGALRCLELAFEQLRLKTVIATCPQSNLQSESVMKKIGMTPMGTFNHPALKEYIDIKKCIWYQISSV